MKERSKGEKSIYLVYFSQRLFYSTFRLKDTEIIRNKKSLSLSRHVSVSGLFKPYSAVGLCRVSISLRAYLNSSLAVLVEMIQY